jgi:hypothetical protein
MSHLSSGMVCMVSPPHFGRGKRRGRRPPEAEGARRGATPRATHVSLRARVARSRASAVQRAQPGGAGGGTGTAGRDLQRLERWGHKDVHRSYTPPLPYSLRLSPPASSHSLASPRTSITRPAPSKPRAPLGLTAEVAARARGRNRHGNRHQRRPGRLAGQRRRPISAEGGQACV